MPTTLPSMGLTLPTRGSLGTGLWGDTIDADLALIDAHDHAGGRGSRIPTAGIQINADLPFSALWAPTQLHRVQFSPIAVAGITGAMTKSLFVSDGTGGLVVNELYYRTHLGASVQITNGGALNVGSFAGTIGGDYAGVGAQLNYTDSAKTYDFKESTADSHGWARLNCGGLRLIEFNTAETFFIAQVAPAALAASYTMTWPTALPGSTVLAQVDSAGQISFSNTLAANQSISVSGTGSYKHGTRTLSISTYAFWSASTIARTSSGISANPILSNTGFAIVLPVNKRILAIRMFIQDSATGPTTYNFTFDSLTSAGVHTTIGTSNTSTGAGTDQTLTLTGLTTTITAGSSYSVSVVNVAGSGTSKLYSAEVDYDEP